MGERVRIGTRGSKLALWQAYWAKEQLLNAAPGTQVDIEIIKTRGDRILDAPFSQIDGKGLFTKELDEALLDGRIDVAVHSLKDLPTELPDGLAIGAVGKREDVRDALVCNEPGATFSGLPQEASVGTSSPRRQALLLHERPDLEIRSVRGNVDTRLGKLESEGLDAVVLATAGLKRLGHDGRISERLPADRFVPAPGQGAVTVLVRSGEEARVATLDHLPTRISVTAERTLLEVLGGGCKVPIGGWARMEGEHLVLTGMVASPDGQKMLRHSQTGSAEAPEAVGGELADVLRGRGAVDLLKMETGGDDRGN